MTTVHPQAPHGSSPTVLPHLTYAGTAGWSGSETSREMAETEAADGTVEDRQRRALVMLGALGAHGMTVKEYREGSGLHHGKASSTLSNLHEGGHVARLTERRDKCAVYVLPEHVGGRETAPHGRNKPDPVDDFLAEWLARDGKGWSKAGNDPRGFIGGLRALTGYGA